jgi:hypothetical protein
VPLIFVTSAQDKTNASGTIAQGTTAANAGKIWLMTGQRDLADTFGVPHFYTDANKNPLHGDELNEYGLQAAYSLLGVSSRAYVVRADIDTSVLLPQASVPNGMPVNGTYWLDTASTKFGIKQWDGTKFVPVKPVILDDDSLPNYISGTGDMAAPDTTFGQPGDYCMLLNGYNYLFYKNNSFVWEQVQQGFNGGRNVQISPHYDYPETATWAAGDIWITTTEQSNGASWKVKRYNASIQHWDSIDTPMYSTYPEATNKAGGLSIPVGKLYIDYNWEETLNTADFKIRRRNHAGPTSIVATASRLATQTYVFNIRETLAGSNTWSASKTVTINPGDNTKTIAAYIPAALAASGLINVSAVYDSATKRITISHRLGGDFELHDVTNAPIAGCGFIKYNYTDKTGTENLYETPAGETGWDLVASNWKDLTYESRAYEPYTPPEDGKLWFSSVHDEVDIMIHAGIRGWVGYQSVYSPYHNLTDPAGPIISVTAPDRDTGNSMGEALVDGDIWISTDDMNRYGRDIYVFNTMLGWVKQDTTDQSTPDGWLFADARWSGAGDDVEPDSIQKLLTYDYVDPDCPDPALYPKGMRLFNTRRSGFNVKKYISKYIDINENEGQNKRYPRNSGESMASYNTGRWVSQHNVAEDGSGVFGRAAQRAQVVAALKSTIDTNARVRDSDTVVFNLIATPGYPEAIQNMIGLNVDRGITAFVIGDTPFRLEPTGTALNAWGLNLNNALDNGDDGATSFDEYMAMYYPSGYTNDNTGNKIVVPPSHMMLRTFINSDAKSFQWFAPAGTRRGGVDNATSVGYINMEGEFKTVALHQSLRDVLYDPSVKINPIATLPGVGIVAYGQRTRAKNASSLDRINVARLVCYLRRQLDILARPFLFEPNDAQTRREIKAAAESLMLELVGQRALYDYVVVCDGTNNTPARIDRNELYMDIAIEPVKAVEFIYIPLRLKNTGDIKAGL